MSDGKPYVFISYSRKDGEYAERLTQALNSYGIETFRDVDLWIGGRWKSLLKKRLDEARVVLVLWSAHSSESDYVRGEADQAIGNDKRRRSENSPGQYMAVTINGFDLNREGVLPYSQYNFLDFSAWDKSYHHKKLIALVRDIQARLGQLPAQAQETAEVSACSEMEDLLVRTVDRNPQIREIEKALGKPSRLHQFFVHGVTLDWLEALADHVMIRQTNRNYTALQGEDRANLRAVPIGVGMSAEDYRRALLDALAAGDGSQEGQAVADWIGLGWNLKVIYTALGREDFELIPDCIEVVNELFQGQMNQTQDRHLIVIFGCLSEVHEEEATVAESVRCQRLQRPGLIDFSHIATWHQRLPREIQEHYVIEEIRHQISPQFCDDGALRYDELRAPLLGALTRSRANGTR